MRVATALVIMAGALGCEAPTPMETIKFTSISVGLAHACALDDRDRPWCWGSNYSAESGNATPCTPSPTDFCPEVIGATMVQGDLHFKAIAVGDFYTCGLQSGGSVFCWGNDSSDVLGTLAKPTLNCRFGPCSPTPVPVSGGFAFTQLSGGRMTVCGVTTDAAAMCWGGSNGNGLLGTAIAAPSSPTPVPITVQGFASSEWESIGRASLENNCGVTSAHQVFCWGLRSSGAIGTGQVTVGPVGPSLASGPVPLHGVTVGHTFACALDDGGAAFCWGESINGTLGVGETPEGSTDCVFTNRYRCYPVPRRVLGTAQFTSLTAGTDHVCGISRSGAAYCWGAAWNGQTGVGFPAGPPVYITEPTLVTGGHHFTALAAGEYYTCGITTVGQVWCWGFNSLGQLGYSSAKLEKTYSPIRVFPVLAPSTPQSP